MNPINRLVLLALFFLLSAPSLASAQSVPELAKKALAATVSLEMQDSNGDTLGHGSGFFVRPNLIVTNYHVIDGASRGYAKLVNTAIVYPINGFTAADKTYDLALLKVSIPGVTPLPVGDSHVVQIGESVYVAGNPQGLEGTFSDGIISGRRDKGRKKERLQMTAPISPGSSGGPVLNRKGEVIGVSTSLYNPIFGVNLAFAVPSNALTALLRRPQKIKPLSSQTQSVSAETYRVRAYASIQLGNYEKAIRELDQALRMNPKDAWSYHNRGIAKRNLGQHYSAILDYHEAIRLDPNDALAYHNRGYARGQLGKYYGAIADYNEAIRLNPKYALAYYNRGNAKGELRRYFAAIADYNKAIDLDSNNAHAYYNRGYDKAQLGQHSAAILDYDAVIRLDPNHAKAYVNRGIAKRNLGQHYSAIADYNAAIRLDPNYALAYHNRGYDKAQLGQHSAAILDYDAAIRLDPNDAKTYVNRGSAKLQLRQYFAAIADYNKAIDLDSNNAHAYFGRGLARSKLNSTQAVFRNPARKDFRIALRLATLADNQNLKARIEKQLRQLDQ